MHSHHRQVNPSDVQSGREFALVATDVRASLAVALSGPEPGPWSGRADGWENWTLDSWVSAGHRYRADTTMPVDEILLGVWQLLLPERSGDENALDAHLANLSAWAATADVDLPPEAWQRAAQVVLAAGYYE